MAVNLHFFSARYKQKNEEKGEGERKGSVLAMLSRIVRTGSRPAISFARSAAYAKSSSRSLIAGTIRSTKPSNGVVNMGIRSMSKFNMICG